MMARVSSRVTVECRVVLEVVQCKYAGGCSANEKEFLNRPHLLPYCCTLSRACST